MREQSGKYGNFRHMYFEDFNFLLRKMKLIFAKKDTKSRKAIPAKERLAIPL